MVLDTRMFWSGFHRDSNKEGRAKLLDPPVSMNASTFIHSLQTWTWSGI